LRTHIITRTRTTKRLKRIGTITTRKMKKEIDLEALKAACREVAENTIWDIRPFDAAKIGEHANTLYQIALRELNFIDPQVDDPNVVVRAIFYLADTQAIPPYWDRTEWFTHMLHVLISLACPEVTRSLNPAHILSENSRLLLSDIKKGIERASSD
jgi:hypothetical protein